MDARLEPRQGRAPIPASNERVHVSEIVVHGLQKLSGVEVAERVRGEIAEGTHRPVNVLKAAQPVFLDLEPEPFAHHGVPHVRQVRDAQVALEHLLLDLIPDHDVEVVGDLVGFHTDEARFDLVGDEVHRGGIEDRNLWEGLVEPRPHNAPEGFGAANLVLPKSGLRLVNTQRNRFTSRGPLEGLRQALLIERVTGFVHHGVQTREGVGLVKTRSEPRVAWPKSSGEGVGGRVHASCVEIETHGSADALAKGDLIGHWEACTFRKGRDIACGRGFGDAGQQGHEVRLEFGEHRVVPRHG